MKRGEAVPSSGDRRGRGASARVALAAGLALGVSIGWMDLLISMFDHQPTAFTSFWAMVPPLAVTAVVFFLLYSLLCFLLAFLLGGVVELDPVALALSVALFLGLLFPLVSGDRLFRFWFYSNLSDAEQLQGLIALLICLGVSVGGYFGIKAARAVGGYEKVAGRLSLVLPLVLTEVGLLVWLWRYPLDSARALRLPLAGLGLLAALVTVLLVRRLVPGVRVEKILGGLMVALVGVGLLALIPSRGSTPFPAALEAEEPPIRPVILIVVDTLRSDYLSCYGAKQVSTPHIDQLARDGILFREAYAEAPWTLPSVGSMMTGLSPTVHLATTPQNRLPDAVPTLAEFLSARGYFTAAIGRNSSLCPPYNLSQGFLEFDFFPSPSLGHSFGAKFLRRVLFPERFRECPTTDGLTLLACTWLAEHSGRPFFLWLHYYDPHQPYEPPANLGPGGEPPGRIGRSFSDLKAVRGGFLVPSAEERAWIEGLYRGEVRLVDEAIGRLLDALKTQGIYDEALIVLTSDHGEEFWEHDSLGHGHTLINEVLRIPLIIKLPQGEHAATEVARPVSNSAITPTILDLCGVEPGEDYLGAPSLASLWTPEAPAGEPRPVVSTGMLYYEDRVAVIADGLKYIRSRVSGQEELYDLGQDPEERTSIAPGAPEELRRARDLLEAHDRLSEEKRRHYGLERADTLTLDKEAREQLRAIGYMN